MEIVRKDGNELAASSCPTYTHVAVQKASALCAGSVGEKRDPPVRTRTWKHGTRARIHGESIDIHAESELRGMHEQHRVNSYPVCNESSPNLAWTLVLPLLFRISFFFFLPLLLPPFFPPPPRALYTANLFSFKGTTCYWSIDVYTRCCFERIAFPSFITHTLNAPPRPWTSLLSFDGA